MENFSGIVPRGEQSPQSVEKPPLLMDLQNVPTSATHDMKARIGGKSGGNVLKKEDATKTQVGGGSGVHGGRLPPKTQNTYKNL